MIPGTLSFTQYFVLHICKCGVLALVPQLQQDRLQQVGGGRVEQKVAALAAQKKFIGITGVKILAAVGFAGGKTITEHLRYIFGGHFNAGDPIGGVVCPIFKMVTIAAFVMHPGGAVSFAAALSVVRTAVTLKIFDTCPELHRGVFGKVVGQSLPIKSQAETIFAHKGAVVMHCFEMSPEIHGLHLTICSNIV